MKKRILFLRGKLFNYETYIENEFKKMGFDIDSIRVSHLASTFDRVVKDIPYLPQWKENRYVMSEYRKLKKDYDYVVVIRGDMLSKDSILEIKRDNPNSKLILYLWDSVLENVFVKSICPLFDVVKSFDVNDCLIYGFEYLPLFYIDEYSSGNNIKSSCDYLFSFVGTEHSDRYFILKTLKKQSDELGYNFYIHLRTSKLGYYKRKIHNFSLKKSEFRFTNLTAAEIEGVYQRSKCVVDIELEVQSGLTMRTFEALASQKKLITTNKSILKSDLYSPSNVMILDRKKPMLDIEFINSDFEYNPAIENYSISKWAQKLFE